MLDVHPGKNAFIRRAAPGRIPPVYAEIPYSEPRDIYRKIGPSRGLLLESIKGPEKIARYSFAAASPFMSFRVREHDILISGRTDRRIRSAHPLKELKALTGLYSSVPDKGLPPFTGGIAGLFSYDFVHYFERIPSTVTDDVMIPDADFLFFDLVVAFDHLLKKSYIIASPGAEEIISTNGAAPEDRAGFYMQAAEKIRDLYRVIISADTGMEAQGSGTSERKPVQIRHEMGKRRYMEIVRRAKEYIRAGDIFQANLSQRVAAEIGDIRPWQIYSILSGINPAPFAAYLDMGDYQIASSSPERLVRVTGELVETRPIAGTRPRGDDAEGDRRMRSDLLLNEKERAEHIMLIDLERNDLGRISDYGTVGVDELMITEDYSHVIHIVSNVRGKLLKGKDAYDVVRATFPGGTITGVPKVRCMEIIDELEPVARGPYTGSVGYIGFSGDMDLNIIIRTFVIKNGTAYVQVGAGIVADSDPEREYYETLKKAEALISTLEQL